jgi:hypothetical protein
VGKQICPRLDRQSSRSPWPSRRTVLQRYQAGSLPGIRTRDISDPSVHAHPSMYVPNQYLGAFAGGRGRVLSLPSTVETAPCLNIWQLDCISSVRKTHSLEFKEELCQMY